MGKPSGFNLTMGFHLTIMKARIRFKGGYMTLNMDKLFSDEAMKTIFPEDLADRFFDALYGDVNEGAYDISLIFNSRTRDELHFEFHLTKRPGKCLACNLTYGLPQVFSRHPIINVNGLVRQIDNLLNNTLKCGQWKIGTTKEISRELHVLPLIISLK